MPSSASTSSPVRQCPCKLLPRSFSSFTAAEYGDLHTLAKFGPAIAGRQDDFGYTPLHLAAQNNHVAATALLLQLGCHVDGLVTQERGMYSNTVTRSCGATPLHRAAFSGATAAMKVLLEWNYSEPDGSSSIPSKQRCNLLAKDTSFGDDSTPLHKAAAGGRYLAVHLLLEAMKDRDNHPRTTERDESLIQRAMKSKDKQGRTPLDVARYFSEDQDSERRAVARWDQVAGGQPNWSKCVQLLEDAISMTNPTSIVVTRKERKSAASTMQLPAHLANGINACMDCDDNGQCMTASWEAAFQEALFGSVTDVLHPYDREENHQELKGETTLPGSGSTSFDNHDEKDDSRDPSIQMDQASGNYQLQTIGMACGLCGRVTVALYPLPSTNKLVCKDCLRGGSEE